MRRNMFTGWGLFLLVLFAFGRAAAGEKGWVSSYDAKLKAEKSASSETVATLPLGTELLVFSFDDRWYHVSTADGKKGFLYRGRVSFEPPAVAQSKGGEDPLGKLLSGVTDSGIKGDSADTSRSIRPLTVEKEKKGESRDEQVLQEELNHLLSRRITSSQIDRFLQEGKVGEYGE
ncbi:MAG: SH3 domain-containing protein [Pseudomonadota bacterium]